jgi:hypothetical protein
VNISETLLRNAEMSNLQLMGKAAEVRASLSSTARIVKDAFSGLLRFCFTSSYLLYGQDAIRRVRNASSEFAVEFDYQSWSGGGKRFARRRKFPSEKLRKKFTLHDSESPLKNLFRGQSGATRSLGREQTSGSRRA